MANGEQGEDRAVPLAEAADRLGLSRDALRMRIRRGKARGFKRGGQVYVWLEDAAPGMAQREAARRTAPLEGRAARPAGVADGEPPGGPQVGPPGGPWSAMVALQKEEIARLIQETERLNARLDRHLEEVREMRQMLQREQVLRQQEQSLRRDVQRLLDRLIAHPAFLGALPGAAPPVADIAGHPERHAPERQAPAPGTQARNEGLAEMLEEIGQSLRELEARDSSAGEDAPKRDAEPANPGPRRPGET